MGNATYSRVYIQVVFAVQNRYSLINQTWEEELYKYITGIVQAKGHKMLAINGMPNHIHIFFGFNLMGSIPDLVREIKKSSNKYINEKKFCPQKFQWQEGYGAFSYSHSAVSNVIKYIQNQKQHHQKKSFKEEYKETLQKFEIPFKEEFLFDWVE